MKLQYVVEDPKREDHHHSKEILFKYYSNQNRGAQVYLACEQENGKGGDGMGGKRREEKGER